METEKKATPDCLTCGKMRVGNIGFYCTKYGVALFADEKGIPLRSSKCIVASLQDHEDK